MNVIQNCVHEARLEPDATAAQIKKVEEQAAGEIEAAGKTARRELKEYAAELAIGLAEERVRACALAYKSYETILSASSWCSTHSACGRARRL